MIYPIPIGSMVLLYMVTFTINIPPMLVYIYTIHGSNIIPDISHIIPDISHNNPNMSYIILDISWYILYITCNISPQRRRLLSETPVMMRPAEMVEPAREGGSSSPSATWRGGSQRVGTSFNDLTSSDIWQISSGYLTVRHGELFNSF